MDDVIQRRLTPPAGLEKRSIQNTGQPVKSYRFRHANGALTSFWMGPNDQAKGIVYGNGLVGNYTYTKLGRTSQVTVKNGATIVLSLSYGYNKTGTVASVKGRSFNCT